MKITDAKQWPVENGSVMGPLLTVSEYAIQTIHKLQYENIHSLSPKPSVTAAFNAHAQEWVKHTVWKEDCRAWYRDNDTGRVNAVWPGSSLHYQHVVRTPRWEDFEIRYKGAGGLEGRGAKGMVVDGKETTARGGNMWAFLGMGWSFESRVNEGVAAESAKLAAEAAVKEKEEGIQGGEAEELERKAREKLVESRREDVSPYLDSGNVDWRWLVAKEGMGEEEAKDLIVRRAGERAMKAMRRTIDRVDRGEEARGWSTSGFDMGSL